MLTVHYSDGQSIDYPTPAAAALGIEDLVFGSEFAITVDSIAGHDGVEYGATFSVEVAPQ